MPWKYTHFDEVLLPQYNPVQAHDAVGTRTTLVPALGGYYDYRGAEIGDEDARTITLSGVYVGATAYLEDENGNRIVDETGAAIIADDDSTSVAPQVQAWREQVRRRGTLWRVRLEDETIRSWKRARLLTLRQSISRNDP